jgi:hypothetical protein
MHLGFMKVIVLRVGHQHVSATDVAIFRVVKKQECGYNLNLSKSLQSLIIAYFWLKFTVEK